jgi:hypothetical protein
MSGGRFLQISVQTCSARARQNVQHHGRRTAMGVSLRASIAFFFLMTSKRSKNFFGLKVGEFGTRWDSPSG